jgi:dTMP kinase
VSSRLPHAGLHEGETAGKKSSIIVFEGIDGSGKTSVSRHVYRQLRKELSVKLTSEPYDRKVLETARGFDALFPKSPADAISCGALLFTCDRARHTLLMEKWVAGGKTVLCDRYFMSTLAYQGAQFAMHGVDRNAWLRSINEPFLGIPDILVYLESAPSAAMRRIIARDRDRSVFESEDFLCEVSRIYAAEYERFGGMKIRINSDRQIEDVQRDALAFIKKSLKVR